MKGVAGIRSGVMTYVKTGSGFRKLKAGRIRRYKASADIAGACFTFFPLQNRESGRKK
jgi:hypothetical protein